MYNQKKGASLVKKKKKKVLLLKHCYCNILWCGSTATLAVILLLNTRIVNSLLCYLIENLIKMVTVIFFSNDIELYRIKKTLAVYWPHWPLLAFLKSEIFAISKTLCTFQSAPSSMIWSIPTEPSRFTAVFFAFSFDIECFIGLWNSPST